MATIDAASVKKLREMTSAGIMDCKSALTSAEGDFDRAFLVHTGDETDFTGEIQTWPLSRIDELAALLAKESPP